MFSFQFQRNGGVRLADVRIFFEDFQGVAVEMEVDGLVAHVPGNGADETDRFFKVLQVHLCPGVEMGGDDAVVVRVFAVHQAGNEVGAAEGEGHVVWTRKFPPAPCHRPEEECGSRRTGCLQER